MFKAELSKTDEETLKNRAMNVLQEVKQQMNRELLELQSYIVTQKLAGQVLHRRSGTLADSVRVKLAEIQGATVTGSVEGAGGPAFYGKYFEEGGTSYYTIKPVRAKALAFMGGGGETVFAASVNHPPTPKKPWFKISLAERREGIIANLQAAAARGLKKP